MFKMIVLRARLAWTVGTLPIDTLRTHAKVVRAAKYLRKFDQEGGVHICEKVRFGNNGNLVRYNPIITVRKKP